MISPVGWLTLSLAAGSVHGGWILCPESSAPWSASPWLCRPAKHSRHQNRFCLSNPMKNSWPVGSTQTTSVQTVCPRPWPHSRSGARSPWFLPSSSITAGPNPKRGNTTDILATETLNGNIRGLKKVHNAKTQDTALQSKHGFQPVLFGLSRIDDLRTQTEIDGLPYWDGRSLKDPFGRDRSHQMRTL